MRRGPIFDWSTAKRCEIIVKREQRPGQRAGQKCGSVVAFEIVRVQNGVIVSKARRVCGGCILRFFKAERTTWAIRRVHHGAKRR